MTAIPDLTVNDGLRDSGVSRARLPRSQAEALALKTLQDFVAWLSKEPAVQEELTQEYLIYLWTVTRQDDTRTNNEFPAPIRVR